MNAEEFRFVHFLSALMGFKLKRKHKREHVLKVSIHRALGRALLRNHTSQKDPAETIFAQRTHSDAPS